MDRQEAIEKLSTIGHISVSYAEDLYDSFFPKPVVPQYVADWYEEHKENIDYELWEYLVDWVNQKPSDFKEWLNTNYEAFQALVNMHQFGYEVEKEARYTVKIKGHLGQYLGKYYLNNEELTPQFIRTLKDEGSVFTRTELESTGFSWVFNCPGIEVKEVE